MSQTSSGSPVRLAVGITGHRGGNATPVAAVLAQIFTEIEEALAAERVAAPALSIEPTRLHTLLAYGVDQLAAAAASELGWEIVAPLPFGRTLNIAINAHPQSHADGMALLAGGEASDPEVQAHANRIESGDGIRLAIIAPDGRDAMIEHAAQLVAAGVPFVFDPGQGLPMFNGAELSRFIEQATWVTVNDYEGKMLSDRTGWSLAEISQRVDGLVVTLGGEGCEVWVKGEKTLVPAVVPAAVVDPTGCGDAWRGALLFGLERGWPLVQCAELGNRVGALKIAQRGPQSYTLDFQPA